MLILCRKKPRNIRNIHRCSGDMILYAVFAPVCYGSLQKFLRSSAPSRALKYAGATSNTVLHPFCPSWFMRVCSSCIGNDHRRCELRIGIQLQAVLDHMADSHCSSLFFRCGITKPPCGIPLWSRFSSSWEMKCTVVSYSSK